MVNADSFDLKTHVDEELTRGMVTIVVPVFNASRFLADCLDSILAQTYENIEVIIVNDGSNDSSAEIITHYMILDKRIKYIHQKNMGVSAARNSGITSALGKYITFVDADDKLHRNAIETMTGIMRETNADVVRTKCNVLNGSNLSILHEDVVLGEYEGHALRELVYKAAIGKLLCYTWLLIVKTDLIANNKIYFPEGVSMMEDMWFYIDLLQSSGSVVISGDVTYDYFVREEGATRSISGYEKKLNSIAMVNDYVSVQLSNKFEREHVNAVNASNMVNYTIINAMRLKKVSDVISLLKKINESSVFRDIYTRANTSTVAIYHRLASWAAFYDKKLILLLIILTRKVVGR